MVNEMKNQKLMSSFIWKFLERMGVQGVQFIVQIVLARLLLPSDYGAIALITIFITISNVFVQSGFNTSLIQKKDIKEKDYSSVFIVSLTIAFILYATLYFASPKIAIFYQMPVLKAVLRVLSITLFFGAFNSIQIAKISREFEFKKLFFSSLISITISGVIGVVLAYLNYGIWALVFQQLSNQIIISLVLLKIVKWKPKFYCNFADVFGMLRFGYKILLSNLIDVFYNNVYGLVIGKVYSQVDLGYYNRADQFPNILVSNINGSIQSVIFPALSKEQNNKKKIKDLMRKSMSLSAFLVFPMMMGLAACARPLILVMLTDKWIQCIPILQILCFSYMLWPIHTSNLQAINAIGRSDVYLKLEIIKKVIGILALIISLPFGIIIMVSSKVFTGLISTVLNAYPNKIFFDYSFFDQVHDVLPSFIYSIVMFVTILFMNFIISNFNLSNFIILGLDIIVGVTIYALLAKLNKDKNLNYFLNYINKNKFR